jgi:hypothetical protein
MLRFYQFISRVTTISGEKMCGCRSVPVDDYQTYRYIWRPIARNLGWNDESACYDTSDRLSRLPCLVSGPGRAAGLILGLLPVRPPGRSQWQPAVGVPAAQRSRSGGFPAVTRPGGQRWGRDRALPTPDGYNKGYSINGGLVVIDHLNGTYTFYGHLSRTFVRISQPIPPARRVGCNETSRSG